ncbi:MAG: low molecular weight protein-tyrosine-phosphatase [Nitrosomonas sp.]|nr:low molecular weight protein-tyrosine-phosphatase [Nitrosomonas sp.]
MNAQKEPEIRILFVCMGNICRSPTADAVFRHYVRAAGLDRLIQVDSAGTHAYHTGEPPDRRAQQAALKRGYSMQGLQARRIGTSDFSRFHYILAMDRHNLSEMQRDCPPDHANKPGLLMQYSALWETCQEVPDPYYGGKQGFEIVLDLVESASQGLLQHITGRIGR